MFEEKKEFQYDYIQGFCEPSHYNCLMPVEYRWDGKEYHKTKMVCRLVKRGVCSAETTCPHFVNAPEIPAEGAILSDAPYK